MPIDSDPGFWKTVAGGIVSVGTTLFGYHKYMDSRLAKKADKEDVQELKEEVGRIRDITAKLFDQQRENEQRAQDRHERLMEKLPK